MSNTLKNKIDFVALVSVSHANCNGDPLCGNRPRTDYDGYGEISDVCVKRKIRNRMQDLGNAVFVQSDDCSDDGCKSLNERAAGITEGISGNEEYAKAACAEWLDVRAFGQLFAFKGKEKGAEGISIGVRGPVSIHPAVSISPVDVETYQITKSVNSETGDKKGSDTMGTKHFVRFGLYEIKGSINAQLAEKTGFTEDDAETIKQCLRTLFVNDASSARPEGSMEVVKLFWFVHGCKDGKYSSAKVHRAVHAILKDPTVSPSSAEDYDIYVDELPGVTVEEIEGF